VWPLLSQNVYLQTTFRIVDCPVRTERVQKRQFRSYANYETSHDAPAGFTSAAHPPVRSAATPVSPLSEIHGLFAAPQRSSQFKTMFLTVSSRKVCSFSFYLSEAFRQNPYQLLMRLRHVCKAGTR
jgi:hypothetical protein